MSYYDKVTMTRTKKQSFVKSQMPDLESQILASISVFF